MCHDELDTTMKVVILCGGRGSRIRDVSELIPKPMLPIGGMPILWHIMKGYAEHGITDFVLCLGYKGWVIKEFFLNYRAMISDFTLTLGDLSSIDFHGRAAESDWKVTLADTGEETYTGGRLAAVRPYLQGEDHFCLTYGDGLADVDIGALVRKHQDSGLTGTLTGVKVAGRFGEMNIKNDRVIQFNEKPARLAGKISGGFMVFDNSRIWDHLQDRPDIWLEREPIESLTAAGQLGVYSHHGFWQCMDTPREFDRLNELWNDGDAPWKIW